MERLLIGLLSLAFVTYWLKTARLPADLPSIVQTSSVQMSSVQMSSVQMSSRPNDLRAWLNQESTRVGRADPDPALTLQRLKQKAVRLSGQELAWLKNTAVDSVTEGDERILAVYLISLSEAPTALDLLKAIGDQPVPRPHSEREHADEIVVRSIALDALVKRLPARECVHYLHGILNKHGDPALAKHAQYWLSRLG